MEQKTYVDKDVLIESIRKGPGTSMQKLFAECCARSVPEIINVSEIVHAAWVKDDREVRGDGEIYDCCCSNCKNPANESNLGNRNIKTPYCSQCGAKMDGDCNDNS